MPSEAAPVPTMVEQSDRAPLLDWEEIPPPDQNQVAQPPREADAPLATGRIPAAITLSPAPNLTAVAASRGETPNRAGEAVPGSDRPDPLGSDVLFSGLTVKDQWEEKDQIVAVFVVTFDTRSGESNHQFSTFFFTWTVDHYGMSGDSYDVLSRTLDPKLILSIILNIALNPKQPLKF